MAVYKKNNRGYSLGSPLSDIFTPPIVAQRAPTTSDHAEIGTVWVDKPNDDVYFLTSIVANSATWINAGGGTGTFHALDVETTVTFEAFATAGVVLNSAAGVLSTAAATNGQVLIGRTGLIPVWSTLTAGGGITITEGVGTITIANPGATGTTMTASDANVVSPDGAGNTDVIGYDTNITTDGATLNTLKIRLADDIVSVASITATNDFTMTAGTMTVTSDDNAADAIYLHANAGVNETIRLHSDQGTGVASISLLSDVGGLTFTSGLGSADAINIVASNAAGGIDVDGGTAGMNITMANGPFDVLTGTGNISIGADATDHDIEIGDAAGVNALALISGTGHTAMTSTGNITLDAAGTVELNSSAGIISIGNDVVAQNINIGTGAAARVVTIGNTTGASQVVLDCGTGGVSVGASATAHTTTLGGTTGASALTAQAGTGAMTFTAGGVFDVNATGNVTIDSTGGTLSIGADADAQAINVGTGAAARTITVGNVTGATAVVVDCGTGGASFGASATAHATTVGSTTGASASTLQAGTGAIVINGGGDVTMDGAGVLELNSSAGIISIGNDAVNQNINVGTAGTRTITIGNNTATTAVDLVAGTGNVSVNSDLELGTAGKGIIFQVGLKIVAGAGTPHGSITAAQGSLYLRTDGTTTNDRAYINTDGGTSWTALTTAA